MIQPPTTMKDWCKEEQPVYKLLSKGRSALSDAELLCIVMGGGSCNEKSLDLSRAILSQADNNLDKVARMSVGDLEFLNMTTKKATALLAAFEIGRRRNLRDGLPLEKISKSADAFEIFKSIMGDIPYEEFWILLLNKANKVAGKIKISEGGISGTVVDPKKVFKAALDHHASAIILGHNHPSGNLQPSDQDKKITTKIKDAGFLLDITILDHLIVTQQGYYSFADEGTL